ncbi:hypothetical protein CZ674_11035 [Agrococcus casei LMG 22410]|uniref:Uncharacterized protein n=1 Tax=Agrococcus casei LMG 22410 TaxID=1255656 RepID=A0A1R4GD13_9MICO|nr:hypothetical protein CZ674_11035 [Agrococcus casei LMG 22410]
MGHVEAADLLRSAFISQVSALRAHDLAVGLQLFDRSIEI